MIGIDVVDFTDPLLKKRNRSHLRFICHPKDSFDKALCTISESDLFWCYWVAKEAVFKCLGQQISFDPKSISIQVNQYTNHTNFKRFCFTSGECSGYINLFDSYAMAIANRLEVQQIDYEIFAIDSREDESIQVRQIAINRLQNNYRSGSNLSISRARPPKLLDQNKPHSPKHISLTHHFGLAGFAITLD